MTRGRWKKSETTATFVSSGYDCLVDRYGSAVLYRKGREDLVKASFAAELAEMAE